MNKSPKIPKKFICKICNYNTSNSKDYNKHLLTAKHKNRTFRTENPQKIPYNFHCKCGKEYTARNSLWYHMRTCNYGLINTHNVVNDEHSHNVHENNKNDILALIQQNHDFKELIVEQNKTIIELSKRTSIQHNNTTNNNQSFNLNFFLNTTCKDAMNMTDFIENIEVEFKDIENIGRNGYVSGMTDMILARIKDLDITKRPLHCTDLKRETMYIKDNNEWSKDTPDNTNLHRMIDYVAKRNYAKIPLWRDNHPECQVSDHPQYDFCVSMMRNILGDVGSEQIRLDNKVIKNLSKHIFVDKAGT